MYRQEKGGPIGLELTGVLARMAMLWWDKAYMIKLKQLGIEMAMYKRYVDDGNMVVESVEPGTRFQDGKLSVHQEALAEDQEIPADKRTAKVLRCIANSISTMIIMVENYPSNHPTGRLPILDLEVWMVNNRVRHQFYRKPMASRKLVQARSAFSTSKKRSILLEDGMRRLRNCSPELSWTVKAKFLNRFSSDLRCSGHTTSFRRTVLNRVLNKYKVDLSNHLEGSRRMYRTREERENSKDAKKNSSQKDTWFRWRKGGFSSTLTVPVTPGGSWQTE